MCGSWHLEAVVAIAELRSFVESVSLAALEWTNALMADRCSSVQWKSSRREADQTIFIAKSPVEHARDLCMARGW